MTAYTDIIDNRNVKLRDEINLLLANSQSVKFAVGYLYLSGFYEIAKKIGELEEAKILTGSAMNTETMEELAESLIYQEQLQRNQEKRKYQTKEEREKILWSVENSIRNTVQALPHDLEKETKIKRLSKLIDEGKIQIKVYTKERLHAKAYIFKYTKKAAEASRTEGIAIVGSSNLTISGFAHSTELNTYVRGQQNYEVLNKWFDELWKEALPFEEVIQNNLNESWALKTVNPYDIYVLTLYHLVKDRLERKAHVIWNWDDMPPLYSFQKVAIMQAYSILNQYNGVFISDVVGIGKTFIGAGLLKQLQKRALVIAPPALVDMWEEFGEKFGIDIRVISRGMLTNGIYDENSLLYRYRHRDVVLIDESHHFRNSKAKRYQEIMPFLADKQVILITATPQNTSIWNIYNQIKLFRQTEENVFPVEGRNLRTIFKKVERGEFYLPELLKHILIRRTRTHIKKFYTDEMDMEFQFPTRKLNTETYNINATYHFLYENIKESMRALNWSRYNLWNYVVPEKQHDYPYIDLKKVITTLKVFHKINLFKRLESSIRAFQKSIANLLDIYNKFLAIIEVKGIVPAGEKIQDYMYRHDLEDIWDKIDELVRDYRAEDFQIEKLKEDLKKDLAILSRIHNQIKDIPLEEDKKFERLVNLIKYIQNDLKQKKILIFSEYADTVLYLQDRLKKLFPAVDYCTSKTEKILDKIKYFAPKANDYHGERSIDIMVATDVLSEGHNLQDCSIVINYDLHWNPVKLIQRIGRVDRIGSIADYIYVHNFLPTERVEREINLKETLTKRIQEIHNYIGEDAQILTEEEQINEEALYTIYDKKSIDELEEKEEVEFTFEEAENFIENLEKTKPEYLALIKKMQLGLRSAKKKSEIIGTYAFFRQGNNARLFIKSDNEIIDNFDKVLTEIRCKPDTPEEKTSEADKQHYYSDIKILEEEFKKYLQTRSTSQKLHPEVLKVKKRLQQYIENIEDEDQIKNIQKLDEILNEFFPNNYIPVLKRLNRSKLEDRAYFNELFNFYNRENFGELVISKEKHEPAFQPIEFICGEILK